MQESEVSQWNTTEGVVGFWTEDERVFWMNEMFVYVALEFLGLQVSKFTVMHGKEKASNPHFF